jgi:hypothetical protein
VTVKGGRKAIAKRLALDGHEHGGRLTLVRRRVVRTDDDNSEGNSLLGAKIARILVFGRSVRIETMMQSYASAAKPRGSGPILHRGLEAMEGTSGHRHLGSSSAAPNGPPKWSSCCSVVSRFACHRSRRRTQDDALWHLARRNETPQCDEQLARQRHDHRLTRTAASVGRTECPAKIASRPSATAQVKCRSKRRPAPQHVSAQPISLHLRLRQQTLSPAGRCGVEAWDP